MVKTHVKGYRRKVKGRTHNVTGYRRKKRKTGRKFKFKRIGDFYVKFDQYGNFMGSRVVKKKKPS